MSENNRIDTNQTRILPQLKGKAQGSNSQKGKLVKNGKKLIL